MERKKASDFPQELLNLFDLYVHGDIERREFLDRAKRFAVGSVTAVGLWESLRANYAFAEQVPKSDPRIIATTATVPSPNGNGEIKGHLAKPSKGSKFPAVLVIHENRGLNPYIEDVARRLATAGYLAFAGDGLTSVGGYPGDDEKGGKLFGTVDRAKMGMDFEAAARWLKAHPEGNGKVGAVGFCFGGGICNALAVRMGADLSAAAPYYGGQAPAADVPKIQAPLMLHYGGLDTRVNAGIPAYEEALKANKKPYQTFIYDNTNHGFHNDTTPRYDEAAAKLSWTRTLEFFGKNLKA